MLPVMIFLNVSFEITCKFYVKWLITKVTRKIETKTNMEFLYNPLSEVRTKFSLSTEHVHTIFHLKIIFATFHSHWCNTHYE